MRTRTTDLVLNVPFSRRHTAFGGGTTTVSTNNALVGTWNKMEDVVTPGFKRRSNRGELIFSPMSKQSQTFSHAYSGYKMSVPTPAGTPVGTVYIDDFDSLLNWKLGPHLMGPTAYDYLAPKYLISEFSKSSAVTLASTDALANWKEASVQGFVFLAELNKTVNTLKSPLQALAKELAFGKKKGYSLSGALRGASGQYLTWFYGIRSMMFDIEGIKEAIEAKYSHRETARGKSEVKNKVTNTYVLHDGASLDMSHYQEILEEVYTVRAGLMGLTEGISSSRNFGVRLADIPAALWELTPWSFVLDWAFNIGDFIQSLSVDASSGVQSQWLTINHSLSITRTVSDVSTGNGWSTVKNCTDIDRAIYVTKSRSLNPLADYSGITFRLDLKRVPVIAAASLVTQQLLKRK